MAYSHGERTMFVAAFITAALEDAIHSEIAHRTTGQDFVGASVRIVLKRREDEGGVARILVTFPDGTQTEIAISSEAIKQEGVSPGTLLVLN